MPRARIAMALVTVALSSCTLSQSGDAPSTVSSSGTYTDPLLGWSVDYPSTMQVGRFSSNARFEMEGIRLTSFSPDLDAPSSGLPPMGWLRSFPDEGVALQIWSGQLFEAPPAIHDDAFPLQLDSLDEIATYVGGAEPSPRYGSFFANGTPFSIAVWFGPHATVESKAAVNDMVASIRFPRLEAWSMWRDFFYVLGSASEYPVGSVTAIPATRLPVPEGFDHSEGVFLVHAPGGFYALPLIAQLQDLPACPVRFDRTTFRFSCAAIDLTWDRYGRATDPPKSYLVADIGPHPVGVTLHGQVVYCPFFGSISATDLWN